MIKKLIWVLCFFLALTLSAQGGSQGSGQSSEENYVILSDPHEVAVVFDQCSRMSPSFRTGYRTLDDATVKKIEILLRDKFAEKSKSMEGKDIQFEQSYRQYVSFEVLRIPYVYINGFDRRAYQNDMLTKPHVEHARKDTVTDWKVTAINICGGGSNYWGALYDVNHGKVTELIFNTDTVRKSLIR